MGSPHWKFRHRWDGSFHLSQNFGLHTEASSSDSDPCGSHDSGWEASSSTPSPNSSSYRRQFRSINRSRRGLQGTPLRGSVRGERESFGWDSSSSSSSSSSGAEETMTSASELLYQRRSRAGRVVELFPPEASRRLRTTSPSEHSHSAHHNDHYDPNYHHYYHCHGSLRLRNFLHRGPPTDRQRQHSEQTSSSYGSSNESNIGTSGGRNSSPNRLLSIFSEQAIENNSLRGAVMQARDHLSERFRASSLVRNRHNSTSSRVTGVEYLYVTEDISLSDAVHWESEITREMLASRNRRFEEVLRMEISPPRDSKPQGLNQMGINNLRKELFVPSTTTGRKGSGEENPALEQEDCSVCLEHFSSGEQLIRLQCRHRFHSVCLTPWLKICGECPYCRSKVLQDSGPGTSRPSSRGRHRRHTEF